MNIMNINYDYYNLIDPAMYVFDVFTKDQVCALISERIKSIEKDEYGQCWLGLCDTLGDSNANVSPYDLRQCLNLMGADPQSIYCWDTPPNDEPERLMMLAFIYEWARP